MIVLTKLNDVPFALNPDMIETVQENPDTTICLFNKNIYIVKESMQEVMAKIIADSDIPIDDDMKEEITQIYYDDFLDELEMKLNQLADIDLKKAV